MQIKNMDERISQLKEIHEMRMEMSTCKQVSDIHYAVQFDLISRIMWGKLCIISGDASVVIWSASIATSCNPCQWFPDPPRFGGYFYRARVYL